MKPARFAETTKESARLLVIDSTARQFSDRHVSDLPALLRPGDLLVVNDAATLPASLPARSPSGAPMEVRLSQQEGDGTWRAVLLGAGDWRTPTELRDPPEVLPAGATIEIAKDFAAEIVNVSPVSERLG